MLFWIPYIDRPRKVRWCHCHPNDSLNQVVYILKRPRLGSVAIYGDWLVKQGLCNKVGNDSAVIHRHPRAIRVEDADYLDGNAILPVVIHAEALGTPLSFIVAGTDADRIDIAVIVFRLLMDKRIAVYLTGGGLHYRAAVCPGQLQHIQCSQHSGFSRIDSILLIMDWRGRTS